MKLNIRTVAVALFMCLVASSWAGANNDLHLPSQTLAASVETPKKGTILIREFFWYGCAHCGAAAPSLEEAYKALGKKYQIIVERTPIAPNRTWEVGARLYYVLSKQGLDFKKHMSVFQEIESGKVKATDQEGMLTWAQKNGFNITKARKEWGSKEADDYIREVNRLMDSYEIEGTPMIGINGKYLVKANEVGTKNLGKKVEKVVEWVMQ